MKIKWNYEIWIIAEKSPKRNIYQSDIALSIHFHNYSSFFQSFITAFENCHGVRVLCKYKFLFSFSFLLTQKSTIREKYSIGNCAHLLETRNTVFAFFLIHRQTQFKIWFIIQLRNIQLHPNNFLFSFSFVIPSTMFWYLVGCNCC